MLKCRIDWAKHFYNAGVLLEFDKFVEGHEDPKTTNIMILCMFLGIYLGPITNLQGIKKVFYLKTGMIKRPILVILFAMPDRVI